MDNLGLFLGAQFGTEGVGPGIVIEAQLGYDDLLGVDGECLVWVFIGNTHVVLTIRAPSHPALPWPALLVKDSCAQFLCRPEISKNLLGI